MIQKLFTTSLFILIGLFASAQKPIMLCNASGTVCTPYYNIDTAYFYAQNGDVIYLPAGVFVLPNLDKEISVIGVGANLDSSLAYGTNTVISNSFDITKSNILLMGLKCNGSISHPAFSGDISNLTIKFCKIEHLLGAENARINNSTIIAVYCSGQINFGYNGFNNSSSGQQGYNNNIYNSVLETLAHGDLTTVNNCIFNAGYCTLGISAIHSSIVNNSIFIIGYIGNYCNPYYCYCGNVFSCTNNTISSCYYQNNGLDGSNQLINCTQYSSQNSTYPFDISLAGGNIPFPVNEKADIVATHPQSLGINGGLYPWRVFSGNSLIGGHGMVPDNPHIYFKNISTTTDANGNLPVEIKVRSGN